MAVIFFVKSVESVAKKSRHEFHESTRIEILGSFF